MCIPCSVLIQNFLKGNRSSIQKQHGLDKLFSSSSDTSNSTGCSCSMLLPARLEEKLHRLHICFKGRSSLRQERLFVSPPDHPQVVSSGQAELVARDLHLLAASTPLVGDQALHVGSVLRSRVCVESVAFSLVHQHNLLGPPLGSTGSKPETAAGAEVDVAVALEADISSPLQTPRGSSGTPVTSSGLIFPLMSIGAGWIF